MPATNGLIYDEPYDEGTMRQIEAEQAAEEEAWEEWQAFQDLFADVLDWATDSSIAKRINFDGTVLVGIAESTDFGKHDVTDGQRAHIEKLHRVWNVAAWKTSRARKAAGLPTPPRKRRRKR